MNDEINNKIQEYLLSSASIRAKMQAKLFSIFTETTGYRPEDLCIVEQEVNQDDVIKRVFWFDLKHRYQTYGVGRDE